MKLRHATGRLGTGGAAAFRLAFKGGAVGGMVIIRFAKSHHDCWPQHSLSFTSWLCSRAGHAALAIWLRVWRFGYTALEADARKRLMGKLSVIFVFVGETGLINENEGDIYMQPLRAAVAELVDAQR